MPAIINLRVGDRTVKATEVTYDDLLLLYKQFIAQHGHVPTTKECVGKNNLPQQRIVNRVLKEKRVTYKDFVALFGKLGHVRAACSDYEMFLEKYKMYSNHLGRALTSSELLSAEYNLPCASWFVAHCPDKAVHNYSDFTKWCGYSPSKKVWSKEEVKATLVRFEEQNNRNVVREDITTSTMGFSMIVINRLFGSLENARLECELRNPKTRFGKPAQYYIDHLTNVVLTYKQQTGSHYISWSDIESGLYSDVAHEHKTYTKHFDELGTDLFAHIKSLGCTMNKTGFSSSLILDNGELVRSSFEYDFTTYLNECGLVYKVDYHRDIKYKEFSDVTSKIDCDYVLNIAGAPVYIEIAGVLDSSFDGEWDTVALRDARHEKYRQTLLSKRTALDSIDAEYYFVFPNDMVNGNYKSLIDSLVSRRN